MKHLLFVVVNHINNDLLVTEDAELNRFLNQAFDSLEIGDIATCHTLELLNFIVFLLAHLFFINFE
jgi:hypothetical protein